MDSARVESDAVLNGAVSSAIEAALQANAYLVSTPCFSQSLLFLANVANEELNSSTRSQTVELRSSSGSTEASATRAQHKGQAGRSQRRGGWHRAVRHHADAVLPQHKCRPNVPLFASARLHETLLEIVSAESRDLIPHGVVSKGSSTSSEKHNLHQRQKEALRVIRLKTSSTQPQIRHQRDRADRADF